MMIGRDQSHAITFDKPNRNDKDVWLESLMYQLVYVQKNEIKLNEPKKNRTAHRISSFLMNDPIFVSNGCLFFGFFHAIFLYEP